MLLLVSSQRRGAVLEQKEHDSFYSDKKIVSSYDFVFVFKPTVAPFRCVVQRRVAVVVRRIDVHLLMTMEKERLDTLKKKRLSLPETTLNRLNSDLIVAVCAAEMKRRVARIVNDVDVGPVLHEQYLKRKDEKGNNTTTCEERTSADWRPR